MVTKGESHAVEGEALPSVLPEPVGRRSSSDRVMSVRMQVPAPSGSWMETLTRSHPELTLEVLDRLELERGRTLFEVRLSPTIARGWRHRIESLPGVLEVEPIELTSRWEVDRVIFRGKTWVPHFRAEALVRRYPYAIRSGVCTWTVIGPRAKVKSLIARLQSETSQVQIASVRYGGIERNSVFLTPRQQEVLTAAIAAGYFEVPRRVTLTRLAKDLSVATSSLSVTLALVEKRLIEHWGQIPE